MQKRAKRRSKKGATEIAQFPLTVYFMFLVVMLPLLNLVAAIIAGCTVYLATNDLAAKAASQPTFAQSLNAMAVEAYNFQSNSLAQFVKMVPQGGYTGCGNDLYVLATDIGGSGVQTSSADQSLASNIDTTKNIYEMQVVSSYTVSPLISLASFPLLGSIPGLGQPIKLSFAASRPIEHPGGMQTAPGGGSTGTVTPFNRVAILPPGATPPASPVTWRTPGIFNQIKQAGQTVVSVNVVIVPLVAPGLVNQNDWTNSGVTVSAGQSVWLDTQAVGTWENGSDSADGDNLYVYPSYQMVAPDCLYIGRLMGYVFDGSTPRPKCPWTQLPGDQFKAGDPRLFQVGNTLLNYKINNTGNLLFAPNNTFTPGLQPPAPTQAQVQAVDNELLQPSTAAWYGAQEVRVVVTTGG